MVCGWRTSTDSRPLARACPLEVGLRTKPARGIPAGAALQLTWKNSPPSFPNNVSVFFARVRTLSVKPLLPGAGIASCASNQVMARWYRLCSFSLGGWGQHLMGLPTCLFFLCFWVFPLLCLLHLTQVSSGKLPIVCCGVR